MRLIDADALMKAMYHRAFETDGDTMWQSGCWVRYRAVEQTVREQPTVDAVPVVRCKYCKYNRNPPNARSCSYRPPTVRNFRTTQIQSVDRIW